MSRRAYVALAEATRVAEVSEAEKRSIINAANAAFGGQEDYSPERFEAHALSTTDEKWAYNAANGGFVPQAGADTEDESPYVITDAEGGILARFADEDERDEALMTGEYPDDAEPAYVN